MKIAYILHNKIIDGSFISWMNLAQSLSQKGCEIVVICPPELENNPLFTNFIKAYHINVYYAFIYLSFVGRRTTKNNWIWYKKHVGALKNKFQSLIQIIRNIKKGTTLYRSYKCWYYSRRLFCSNNNEYSTCLAFARIPRFGLGILDISN